MQYNLHLCHPAASWEDGTPLGNGRCGMMLMGHPAAEEVFLNEDSLWAGGPPEPCAIDFKAMVDESRRLFLEGRDADVDAYVNSFGLTPYRTVKSYEYAGKITVSVEGVSAANVADYTRDLDLRGGVARIHYGARNVRYRREAFSSHPTGLQCLRFSASEKSDYTVTYTRENVDRLTVTDTGISVSGHTATGGHTFSVGIRWETDGICVLDGHTVRISGAQTVTVYSAIATDYRFEQPAARVAEMLTAAARGFDALLAEHVTDFSTIMARSDIDLPASATGEEAALEAWPVSARLDRLRRDAAARDPALLSLYYTFGKYLLVSSSREDSLPANLQGVWSEGPVSPWGADYHVNINLQMNYWHAEAAGLSESLTALFAYMNGSFLEGGRRAAREDYGMRGAVIHHLSDIYGFAGAADAAYYGLWPLGGAWLARHLWEHYLHALDEDFLCRVAYPFIRDCALFFMDYLFEDADGQLLSGPSMSPENSFFVETASGERRVCTTTMSPTMDVEIVGDLLRFYAEVEKLLGIHPEDGATAYAMAKRLPPLRVGKYGQLMEWIRDYEEYEPGHRHISHAYGLYPGASITRQNTGIWEALKVTFARRLAAGGGHSGWSRAWFINFYARLREGENAYANLRTLLTNSTLPNLLDNHPPFQIDGNFGGAAGITEMLVQSHEGFLSLCPALPVEWPAGYFDRLRVRGGYTVSCRWDAGRILEFSVTSAHGQPIEVELPDPDGTVYEAGDASIAPVVHGRIVVQGNTTLRARR